MKKIIMLSGIPGTGKSYYANQILTEPNTFIISSDEIRISMTKSYAILVDDMNKVYNEMINQANALMNTYDDVTVVLDSTFLNDQRRNYFIERLQGYDYLKLTMLKVHNQDLIFARNKQRIKEKWVPEEVLHKMIASYSYPSEENIAKYTEIEEVYTD